MGFGKDDIRKGKKDLINGNIVNEIKIVRGFTFYKFGIYKLLNILLLVIYILIIKYVFHLYFIIFKKFGYFQ